MPVSELYFGATGFAFPAAYTGYFGAAGFAFPVVAVVPGTFAAGQWIVFDAPPRRLAFDAPPDRGRA